MRDKIFYSVCLGLILGVLLRSFVIINLYFVIAISIIACGVILFSYLSSLKWGVVGGVLILSFTLGIFRFHISDKSAPEVFESKVGDKLNLTGEIIDEPDQRENNQKITVETELQGQKTKILMSVGLGEDLKYGDAIKFSGKLQKPENFLPDQGKTFDYINYLRKDGIYYLVNYGSVEVTSHSNGSFIKSALFNIKEKFLEKMSFAISSPENLLMGGLILGEKSQFDQSLRKSFVDTGTIHIVALSGYNVTIVAEWIMQLFSRISFVPKNFGIGFGIFSIILFILMTGGSSTAIRAGIMAILALVARATGRNYDVARALILAGVFMILLNPLLLVYDVSFQLSFIATVAVIFLAPRIEKYFKWVPEFFQLRDIVTVTCAAYIFVAPFILYEMGNFSLVALPANILILPFIPFTMMLGFITGFAGLVWYGFGVPIGFISYIFLRYELAVIAFFSHLPFAAFSISNFPLWITILIYVYFIYRLFGRNILRFFSGDSTEQLENSVQ
ncbi:ComEC family competence protein [Patescibacteria group bacterium]|nr:ComEC family competence protein [Patescibacteria group bacterium]